MTRIELPDDVKYIIRTLEEHGHAAYAVGGCVRDFCLGREPDDWDITTSARPAQIKELFRRTIDTGIKHGTVTVMMDKTGYEVTTYRIDGEYTDGRHPDTVTFTDSLTEDLKRRDFTINAMAYNDTVGLVDQFGGMQDLTDHRIRCVGNPTERFSEDALRMLRAVRFAAQLGFDIDAKTLAAIKTMAPTLKRVSAERIHAELMKLLVSDHPWRIRTACEAGLTAVFLPEFDTMMITPQNTPHHCYSVGEHTIRAIEEIRPDKTLRMAMLLHDVAKPAVRRVDEKGRDHFDGHPAVGVEMAREIMKRLRFDNDSMDYICRLIRFHDERPRVDERAVRRFASAAGRDLFPDLWEVKYADLMAQSDYLRAQKLEQLIAWKKLYEDILAKDQALTVKDLAVNGKDMIALGMPPGPAVGEMLNYLLDEVLENPEKNDRQTLILLAKRRFFA